MKSVVVSFLALVLFVGVGLYVFNPKSNQNVEYNHLDKEKLTKPIKKSEKVSELGDEIPDVSVAVESIPVLAKKQMEAMKNKPDHSLEKQKRDQLQGQADEKRAEIETLIVSLSDNLADPNKRKSIQAKLDASIEQYNTLFLPLALEKMTARVSE